MPTFRQRKALKEIVENGGNVSKGMEAAGYTHATAKTPQKLTQSKGWEELLDEYLPDELLTNVAKEGLNATQVKTSLTEPDRIIPDYGVRQRYLETVLKMKGKITDKSDINFKGEIIASNVTIDTKP